MREAAFSKIFTEYGIKIAELSDSDSTYTLIADVSFTPLQMSGETKNKYIRFVVNANLTEIKTDKIVLPFAISGREAHLSEAEATIVEHAMKGVDILKCAKLARQLLDSLKIFLITNTYSKSSKSTFDSNVKILGINPALPAIPACG